jgi:hypothetical protein
MDFTVLAATSVLNDLIDKCPPAEACRDAFERMSRATVQMCLATTGFSSQTSGLSSEAVAPQRAYRPTEGNASDQEAEGIFGPDAPSWSNSVQDGSVATPIAQRSQGSRRPPPKFDMNFGDLFSEEVDGNARSSRQNYRSRPTTGFVKIEQQHPPPGGLGQRDLSLKVSNIDPNLQTHEHQQQAEQQAQEGFVTPTQPSYSINTGNANTNTFPEFFGDADFALDNGTGNPGIDLGFGLPFDIDHDFSDGSQFDLFDGFFFGPSGAGLQYVP